MTWGRCSVGVLVQLSMAEGKSGQCWVEEVNGHGGCLLSSKWKYHIVGWIQVVFPGVAKMGAVVKLFSQGNSQFPGEWVAPELLGFPPGHPCLGTGWPRLSDWKVQ
jgi:hypothetical protein